MKIIGLAGFKKSGKDTLADYLVRFHGFQKYSFADPLRRMIGEAFGWSWERMTDQSQKEVVDEFWGISPRQALQYMGTEVMRQAFPKAFPLMDALIGSNFWVKRFEQFVGQATNKNIVVSDMRFQNEVDAIVGLSGVAYRVHRSAVVPLFIEHPSEDAMALTRLTGVINNDGTVADLYSAGDSIVRGEYPL